MDVLVLWEDGSQNVVSSNELKTVKCKRICVGKNVKMLYDQKWYTGTVLAIEDLSENDDTNSEDSISLADLRQQLKTKKVCVDEDILENIPLSKLQRVTMQKPVSEDYENCENNFSDPSDSAVYDSDEDPTFGICEIRQCKKEVFAACHRCQNLVCFDHFNDSVCIHHNRKKGKMHNLFFENICDLGKNNTEFKDTSAMSPNNQKGVQQPPESFLMDGEAKEGDTVKVRRPNKQKLASKLRNLGKNVLYRKC